MTLVDTRVERAESLIARAQDDGEAVAAEAAQLIDECAPDEHEVQSLLLRAWGLAVRWTQTLDRSIELLERSIDEARLAGRSDLAIESQRSLAGSLALNGQADAALTVLDAASTNADPMASARLAAQRATILARLGQLAESDSAFSLAIRHFASNDEPEHEAMTLANRGYLRLSWGRVREAATDLGRALDIYRRRGNDLMAAGTRHNLGHVALYRGQLAEALRIFSETEREIAELTGNAYEMQVSHGEALMSAGLFDEAYHLAARIAEQMSDAGLDLDRAEALLLAAEAALAMGDLAKAVAAANDAAEEFRRQGRDTWADRAALIALQGDDTPPTAERRDRARALSESLDLAGQAYASARGRVEAVRLGLAIGDIDGAQIDIDRLDEFRTHGPIELRLAAWHARALGQRANGQSARAVRSLAAGLRLSHRHQASLRASDLRAAVAKHTRQLALLGCQILLERDDPMAFTDWTESYRAASLRLAPVEADTNSQQTELLAELRAVSKRLDEEPAEASSGLLRRRAQLVHRLQDESRAFGRDRLMVHEPIAAAQLLTQLGHDPHRPVTMVQYVETDGEIAGILLSPAGQQIVRLGDAGPVRSAQRRLGRALDDLAARRHVERAVAAAHMARAELDERLAAPLGLSARDDPRDIVIVPNTAMFALPWSVLPTYAPHVVTVAPSCSHWGRRTHRGSYADRPTLLVGGPDLEEADAELDAIAALGGETITLKDPESTVEEVLAALPRAGVAHLACHGAHRRGNALFSHLRLADGELTIFELEHARAVPEVVVLSACESAATDDVGGAEMLGLTIAFLSLGTRSLVAGPSLVADAALTRDLMTAFHANLRAGRSVAEAWFVARRSTVTDDPALALLRDGSFNCYGV